MLTRKCDICGREIGMVNAHYQLIFDGGFVRKEKDICISCFNRIKNEAEKPQQADTPQTDSKITELAKEIVHKMIDNSDIAEDAYLDLRQRMHEAVERLDEYYPSEDERRE